MPKKNSKSIHNKKVLISVKTKILSLIFILLSLSIGGFSKFATDQFVDDKSAYIYDSNLNKLNSFSKRLDNLIEKSTSQVITLAYLNQTSPEALAQLFPVYQKILYFKIFDTTQKLLIPKLTLKNDQKLSEDNLIKIEKHVLSINKAIRLNLKVVKTSKLEDQATISIRIRNVNYNEEYFIVIDATQLIENINQNNSNKIYITDNKGKSYFNQTNNKRLFDSVIFKKSKQGSFLYEESSDINFLTSFSKLSKYNMILVSATSAPIAFKASIDFFKKNIIFAFLIFTIALILGIIFSTSITSPIHSLMSGTENLAKRIFDKEIEITSNDEIGILARSFNFMSSEISKLIGEKDILINKLQSANVKLEDYSKNLEIKVKERTRELQEARDFLDATVNSLDQGLVVFDKNSICNDFYTKACENLFKMNPALSRFEELINLNESETSTFKKWTQTLFGGRLAFSTLAPLGPDYITEGENYTDKNFKQIELKYFPMHNADNELTNVVAVATDVTREHIAKEGFKEQEAFVKMVVSVVNNKKQFLGFHKENQSLIQRLIILSNESHLNKDQILLLLHTLKGNSQMYSMVILSELIHSIESEFQEIFNDASLDDYRDKFIDHALQISKFFKTAVDKIKETINLNIDDQNKVVGIQETHIQQLYNLLKTNPSQAIQYLENNILGSSISELLKPQIEEAYKLAKSQEKVLNPIKVIGGDVRVDDSKFGEFFNNITHLFRNCVDHGIETPINREQLEKSPEGDILIQAKLVKVKEADYLQLTITDNGRGISPQAIRDKLSEIDPDKDYADITDAKIIYHIFDQSFSTIQDITEVSGRGIGMSAIKESVIKLGGTIQLQSKLNQGTVFRFNIPV